MRSQTKLTRRTVEAIETPSKGKLEEVWDSELRGFHVRVNGSGRRTFRLFYRFGGRQRVATIGELSDALTTEQARSRARTLLAEIIAGRDPLAEAEKAALAAAEARRRAVTVNQMIDTYLERGPLLDPAKRARSWEHDRSCLEAHVRPLLGKLHAANVRPTDVEKMVADIIAGKTRRVEKIGPRAKRIVRGGKAAARAAMVALQTVYSWSEKRELVSVNPCKNVKKPPASKRERFLSETEAAHLLDTIRRMEEAGTLNPVFGDTLRVLALTGCRRSEIERLEWSEIDFGRGVVFLPTSRGKTGRRTIPLSAPALAILAGRPRTGRFVFASPLGEDKPANALSKNWQKVREAAGLPEVRVHDLRHTLASLLVAKGNSLPIIGKVLGHTSAQTTQRYAHLQADPLRAVVDEATAAILAKPASSMPDNVSPLRRK